LATKAVSVRLNPVRRLLLGPGPQNADPRVHAAMSLPQIGHMDGDFLRIVEDIKHLLRYVWQTGNEFTVPVSGTGSAAWEAGVANLTEVGDVHLICVNGYFGERALDLHGRYTEKVEKIEKPPGQPFTVAEVENGLRKYKPNLLWLCHAETSTGCLQGDMKAIGMVCKKYGCLLMLDTVTSICGVEVKLDEWQVDCCYAGGQKCMGCPPGMAPLTMSPLAVRKMEQRKSKVPNWYLDMTMLRKYMVAPEGAMRVYHHTAPISMAYAMREALTLVAEEGLDVCQKRHRDTSSLFHRELSTKLNLECFVSDPGNRLPPLTTVQVPEGVDAGQVVGRMRDVYGIEIGHALGTLKGKCWRIGLMGYNCRPDVVMTVCAALGESIETARGGKNSGADRSVAGGGSIKSKL